MKKLLFTTVILSAVILFITGCQKNIIIDIGQIKPRLVVNSILDKDSLIRVQLSKSKSMMDSTQSIDRINEATISIFEDNIFKQTMSMGHSGLFTSTMKPKLASEYRIEIANTEFGLVEASAIIPAAPQLISATQTTELTPGSTTQNIKYKIVLQDVGGQPNYYYLRANIIKKGYLPGASPNLTLAWEIFSDDNVVVTDNHILKGVIFDNSSFVGNNYELIVYTPYRLSKDFNLWFELTSISADYDKYIVSSVMQNNAGQNPFAEPVVIKSNIQNGIGIFGAKNSVFIKAKTF